MNQVVTPQVQHAYLHPVFAPADLEAAASSTGASRVTLLNRTFNASNVISTV